MDATDLNFKMSDRIINLMGDIEEATVQDTIQKIIELNCKDDEHIKAVQTLLASMGFGVSEENIQIPPIIINLSTYGGECYAGLGLCDCIRTSETPVKIVCYGKIMSMGIPILLSAKHRCAHRNTIFMIHGISWGTWGKAQQTREASNETDRLEKQITEYILSHSKFPRKKMLEIIEKKQDYYFTAEEALKYKIIDEIIEG